VTDLLDDIADVRKTIRYWQNRGVRVVDVAPDLHCARTWSAIEQRMMEWMLAYDAAELSRAA
jgi:hypothetical protein